MFKKKFQNSISFRFLSITCLILVIGTLGLSVVVAINEQRILMGSLLAQGRSLASLVARQSGDSVVLKDYQQLDAYVNDLHRADIAYAVISDEQGNLLTSQFASINYRSARFNEFLSHLPKESSIQDIIGDLKKLDPITEVSAPIEIGLERVGKITIGMSEYRVKEQITHTILFIIVLNMSVALVLTVMLFVVSRKMILDPIVELTRATRALASGDLSNRVEVKTTGELKLLADRFNQMLDSLETVTVSRDYVDTIIKSIIDALIVLSPHKKIIMANDAAVALLGYQEKELIGNPIAMILDGGTVAGDAIIGEISSKGLVSNLETNYLTKDGSKIPVLISGSTMSVKGKMHGIVCVAKDLTDRKKNEEELLKHRKLESVSILAKGITHDFNNLLTSVMGYISLSRELIPPSSQAYEYLATAETACVKVKELTRQLEEFASGVKLVRKRSSLVHLLQDICTSLSKDSFKINMSVPDNLWPAEIDERQISQVMHELIENAGEAMPNGGVIEIVANNAVLGSLDKLPLQEGKYIEIADKDHGTGIAKENLPKVFEPYFTTKQMGYQSGVGLGLALCYSIIQGHKGHIVMESEPGKGTVVHIYIPAASDNTGQMEI